jgi:hypothetical protein
LALVGDGATVSTEYTVEAAVDVPALVDDQALDDLNGPSGLESVRTFATRLHELLSDRFAPIAPILVWGDWGTGKTSVLRHLRHVLELRDASWKPVLFEAWAHERESNLFIALVRRVLEEVNVLDNPKKTT